MPVHAYTIKAGSSGRRILVYGRTQGGDPAVGLTAESLSAAFVRDDGSAARRIERAVREVDAELTPGVYEVWLPAEAIAREATRAMVIVRHATARFDPVDIDLVMYDPQDSVRLGMTALGPEQRIAALRGAFPRLSELELQARAALAGEHD